MIPQDAALRLQLAAIAGNEPETSLFELRPLNREGRPARRAFVPVRDLDGAAALIAEQAATMNAYIGVAPRVRKDGSAEAVERVWTLWADIDGPEGVQRLAAFRPLPSIVIRSGSPDSVHAYWPLRRPVSRADAQRCNRRLALALGGDMKATDAPRILRPAGTLNYKHEPPAPVTCTRLELDVHEAAAVVHGLPDSEHYARRRPPGPRAAAEAEQVLSGLVSTVASAQEGNRNAALYWAACRALEGGHEDALAELRDAALFAGLPEHEIERTVASASRAAA